MMMMKMRNRRKSKNKSSECPLLAKTPRTILWRLKVRDPTRKS